MTSPLPKLETLYEDIKIARCDTIISTITTSREILKENPDLINTGLVVTAAEQTNGIGQPGKKWASQQGGLYYSLTFKPKHYYLENNSKNVTEIAKVVRNTINSLTGLKTYIKPINDIYIDQKKCAGILLNSSTMGMNPIPSELSIGIGLNLNQTDFPKELEGIAISLKQKTGETYKEDPFVIELTKGLLPLFS